MKHQSQDTIPQSDWVQFQQTWLEESESQVAELLVQQ